MNDIRGMAIERNRKGVQLLILTYQLRGKEQYFRFAIPPLMTIAELREWMEKNMPGISLIAK